MASEGPLSEPVGHGLAEEGRATVDVAEGRRLRNASRNKALDGPEGFAWRGWLNANFDALLDSAEHAATLQSSHDLALAGAERLREVVLASDGVDFAKAVSPAIAKFLDDHLDDYLSSEEAADHLAHTVHDALRAALKLREPGHG